MAGGSGGVAGGPGRRQRRHDDLAPRRRPTDPRRPRPARGHRGVRRPAASPGHDAAAARGVARVAGPDAVVARRAERSTRDVLHQGPRGAPGRQPGAVGGARRRLLGAADRGAAASGVRVGRCCRATGPRRWSRCSGCSSGSGCATSCCSGRAATGPSDLLTASGCRHGPEPGGGGGQGDRPIQRRMTNVEHFVRARAGSRPTAPESYGRGMTGSPTTRSPCPTRTCAGPCATSVASHDC